MGSIRRYSVLALIPAIVQTAGCGVDDQACVVAPGEPTAWIGAGLTTYSELSDGDRLQLEPGNQGGYHFLLNAEAAGIAPGDPEDLRNPCGATVWYEAFDIETGVAIHDRNFPDPIAFSDDGSGRLQMIRGEVLRIRYPIPKIVVGQFTDEYTEDRDRLRLILEGRKVRVGVTITDTHGTVLHDSVEVIATFSEP